MSVLGDAMAALEAAAAGVAGVRVHKVGDTISPPAVVVGPPRWESTTACGAAPTEATFPVWVVVALDAHALEALFGLAPAVAEAIEKGTPAVVREVFPATYLASPTELPAYELTVEFPL